MRREGKAEVLDKEGEERFFAYAPTCSLADVKVFGHVSIKEGGFPMPMSWETDALMKRVAQACHLTEKPAR